MPCAKGLFSDTAGGVEGGREEMRLSTGTREDPWASEASTGLPGSTGTFCSRRSHQLSLPISLCEEPWEHGDRERQTHTHTSPPTPPHTHLATSGVSTVPLPPRFISPSVVLSPGCLTLHADGHADPLPAPTNTASLAPAGTRGSPGEKRARGQGGLRTLSLPGPGGLAPLQ